MAETFEAVVAVLDKASAPMAKISAKLSSLTAPVRRLNLSFANLGERTGLTRLSEAAEGVEQHVGRLRQSLGGLAGPIETLGGLASVGGLIELSKRSMEFGANLQDASEKTGVAVDALARLHYAAQQNGGDAATLDKALEHLNETLVDSASGKNKEMAGMFAHLGIAVKDSAGHVRDAGAVFTDLAQAVKLNAGNHGVIDEITKAFGQRSGAEMLPMLREGREGLVELGAEFDRFHGRVVPKFTEDSKSLEQSYGRLGTATEGLADRIGYNIGGRLQPVIDFLGKFVAAHQEAVANVATGAGALGGIALLSSGPVMAGAKGLLRPLLELGKGFGTVIRASGEFAQAMRLGFGVMDSLALVGIGPMALVVAGVVAVAAGAYLIYKNWVPIKAFFVNLWNDITGIVAAAWKKIEPLFAPIEKVLGWMGSHGAAADTTYAKKGSTPHAAAVAISRASARLSPDTLARMQAQAPVAGPSAASQAGAGGYVAPGRPLHIVQVPTAPAAAAAGAPGPSGTVHVKVDIAGAPADSRVSARSTGDIEPPDVGISMMR